MPASSPLPEIGDVMTRVLAIIILLFILAVLYGGWVFLAPA